MPLKIPLRTIRAFTSWPGGALSLPIIVEYLNIECLSGMSQAVAAVGRPPPVDGGVTSYVVATSFPCRSCIMTVRDA